jgi:hypothetical protein
MEILPRLINPILGFLLTVIFGLWLSRRGKPYGGLLFNVHKLIALATVILAGMAIYQKLKEMDVVTLVLALLVIASLSVIALFVSGALMSAGKGEYRIMKLIHNVSPFVLVLTVGCTVYLFPSA